MLGLLNGTEDVGSVRVGVSVSLNNCLDIHPGHAKTVSVVSNFAAHSCNFYRVASNATLAKMLGFSPSQLARSKRQLAKAGFVGMDGAVGDLTPIIEHYEARTGETWRYRLQ